jgi:hypothetical protein
MLPSNQLSLMSCYLFVQVMFLGTFFIFIIARIANGPNNRIVGDLDPKRVVFLLSLMPCLVY